MHRGQQMVFQVLADIGKIETTGNPRGFKFAAGANTGEHQDTR